MAETGSDEKRGNDSPYEFDPGKSFFGSEGHSGTIEGTFKQVDDTGTTETIDPGTAVNEQRNPGDFSFTGPNSGGATGESGTGKTGKRKYTRRGSKEVPTSLGGFEDAIFAIHLALAGIARCPELEIDEDEAKKVTAALDRLAAFYHVEPSETAKVWMNFAGAMSAVYAPRAVAIYKRLQREQNQTREKVVPIR